MSKPYKKMNWSLRALFLSVCLFPSYTCSHFGIIKNFNKAFFPFVTYILLCCSQRRWDNILRCNRLFGIIGHFGLLKDVNISFFLSSCTSTSMPRGMSYCTSMQNSPHEDHFLRDLTQLFSDLLSEMMGSKMVSYQDYLEGTKNNFLSGNHHLRNTNFVNRANRRLSTRKTLIRSMSPSDKKEALTSLFNATISFLKTKKQFEKSTESIWYPCSLIKSVIILSRMHLPCENVVKEACHWIYQ